MAANVDYKHPQYQAWEKRWNRVRLFTQGGRDEVKDAGEEFLPKPTGMSANDYRDVYLKHTPFSGYSDQTVSALAGACARKPAELRGQRFLQKFQENVDGRNMTFESFKSILLTEMVRMGRVGVMVDQETRGGRRSRPYWSMYTAESIWNWGHADNGDLELVVLYEPTYRRKRIEGGAIPFELEPDLVNRWRVLYMDGRVYRAQIFEQQTSVGEGGAGGDQTSIQPVGGPITPKRMNKPLNHIPFYIAGARDRSWDVDRPPVLNVVDAHWDMYQRGADYTHALHMTSNPMPWAAAQGLRPDATDSQGNRIEVKWGSGRFLTLPDGGKAGLLEVTGNGAETNREAIRDLKTEMAFLGAELVPAQGGPTEATQTHQLRQTGRTANLVTIVHTATDLTTEAARELVWWDGVERSRTQTTKTTLSDDLVDSKLSAPDIVALLTAVQAGKMPLAQWFYNLERGERLRPGTTLDQFKKELPDEDDLIDDLDDRELSNDPLVQGGRQPGAGATEV